MKLTPDDPRLTAYALGELTALEARQLEAELEHSPEARAVIDETRALASLLADGLAAESAASQAPADARIAAALEERLASAQVPTPDNLVPLPQPAPRAGVSWGLWIAAAAACVVLGTLLLPQFLAKSKSKVPVGNLARLTPPKESLGPVSTTAPRSTSSIPTPSAVSPTDATDATDAPDATVPVAAPAPADSFGRVANPGPAVPVETSRMQVTPPTTAGPEVASATPVSRQKSAPARSPITGRGGAAGEAKAEFAMSPELMKRYGLVQAPVPASAAAPATAQPPAPLGGIPVNGPAPAPTLRHRYGLAGPQGRDAATAPAAPTATRGLDAAGGVRATSLASVESRLSELSEAPNPQSMRQREDRLVGPDNPGYVDVGENPFRPALDEPLSTFSLDVDTGSYANIRRFLNSGRLPPRDAVRIEEMLNYFRYEVAAPRGDEAFGTAVEVAACPWAPGHRLVRLAIKARGLDGPRPPGNFVFLVDVSGSMAPDERLPLLKQALKALVRRLAASDRIAIVTYASSAGIHLPSTSGEDKETILAAIDALGAGGSTNGEGGIRSAYEVATTHFQRGGVNRVLLCTDGDFNVGLSNQDALVRLIEQQARSGVFLTTLGVGTDNFKDALMRRLADRGNGSYHYLDSFEEAQRVLIGEMDATFVTVARDAKAQVEFNPARVGAWRLLGYEKRLMAHQDFNDDTKDGGEVGAGHLVTVLYEIVPPGAAVPAGVDPLKYQRPAAAVRPARDVVPSDDLLTLKLRYQRPEGSRSTLLELPVKDDDRAWSRTSPDFQFAAAVASFGMVLRDSPNRGAASLDSALELGRGGLGPDRDGWRAEFLALVQKARSLSR